LGPSEGSRVVNASPSPPVGVDPQSPAPAESRHVKPKRWPLWLALAVVLIAAVVFLIVLLTGSPPRSPGDPPERQPAPELTPPPEEG
jgi:hypothetical protein